MKLLERFIAFLEGDYDVQDPYPRAQVSISWKYIKCETCGESVTNHWEAYQAVINGNVEPPDDQDSLGINEPLVSAKMVDELTSHNVTGFVPHRIPVMKQMGPGQLEEISDAEFYWLNITGRIDVDTQLFNNGEDSLCNTCGSWFPRRKLGHKISWGRETPVPVMNTWDGSDFCKFGNVRQGQFWCSRRIVELQSNHKWKGLCFSGCPPRLNRKIKPDKNPDWLQQLEVDVLEAYPDLFPETKKGAVKKRSGPYS